LSELNYQYTKFENQQWTDHAKATPGTVSETAKIAKDFDEIFQATCIDTFNKAYEDARKSIDVNHNTAHMLKLREDICAELRNDFVALSYLGGESTGDTKSDIKNFLSDKKEDITKFLSGKRDEMRKTQHDKLTSRSVKKEGKEHSRSGSQSSTRSSGGR
jgi:hypothetical protein